MTRQAQLLAAAAIAIALQPGCTRTVYHAVVNPLSAADGGQCFQDCQRLRSQGTKAYLGCVRICPRTRVVEDQRCENIFVDSARFECTTERDEVFSAAEVIVGVVIGVIVFGLLAWYFGVRS